MPNLVASTPAKFPATRAAAGKLSRDEGNDEAAQIALEDDLKAHTTVGTCDVRDFDG